MGIFNNLKYAICKDSNGFLYATIYGYEPCINGDIIIPSIIPQPSIPVKIIATTAFQKALNICSITLEEGIEVIEDYAFYLTTCFEGQLSKLETVKLPSSIKEVGSISIRGDREVTVIVSNKELADKIYSPSCWLKFIIQND